MRLLLIRHGKTKGNLEKRYVGRTDESILREEILWKDKKPLPLIGKGKGIKLYVSPMIRCKETAEFLFPGYQLEEVENLRECDFGDFEYQNYTELATDPRYQQWIDSNGTLPFPNGESVEEFKTRCNIAFYQIMEEAFQKQLTDVIMVIHGGTIMAIMEQFAREKKSYYDWQVENLGGFLGEVHREGFLGEVQQESSETFVIDQVKRI